MFPGPSIRDSAQLSHLTYSYLHDSSWVTVISIHLLSITSKSWTLWILSLLEVLRRPHRLDFFFWPICYLLECFTESLTMSYHYLFHLTPHLFPFPKYSRDSS